LSPRERIAWLRSAAETVLLRGEVRLEVLALCRTLERILDVIEPAGAAGPTDGGQTDGQGSAAGDVDQPAE
jgi:hypothetical protein